MCSPVLIMYFQIPLAALASCGRAYLIVEGQVKPSSTFSNDELVSDRLEQLFAVQCP